MINKVIEEQILKVALSDIDINALAAKFKPLIEKQLEKEFKDYITHYDFNDDGLFYEIMEEHIRKVLMPELKQKLGMSTQKKGK